MQVVIFEVWPTAEGRAEYLAIAARLKRELAEIDGFISVERFTSMVEEGKLLSVSFWRDAAAVAAWRSRMAHLEAQSAGRRELFRDYRIRVAEVLRDYGPERREQAPQPLP